MPPLETLDNEDQQYETLLNESTENLQKIASLNTGKLGIIARHELEARYFKENKNLSTNTIELAGKNITLTKWVIGLTVFMLLVVGFQAYVGWRQTQIVEKEYYARPEMFVEFVNFKKVAPHAVAFEVRIKNLGERVTDQAILHMYIPKSLELGFLDSQAVRAHRPVFYKDELWKTEGPIVTHYEWHVAQRYYIGRPRILGEYIFRFKDSVKEATIYYQIVSEGGEKIEELIIQNPDVSAAATAS